MTYEIVAYIFTFLFFIFMVLFSVKILSGPNPYSKTGGFGFEFVPGQKPPPPPKQTPRPSPDSYINKKHCCCCKNSH